MEIGSGKEYFAPVTRRRDGDVDMNMRLSGQDSILNCVLRHQTKEIRKRKHGCVRGILNGKRLKLFGRVHENVAGLEGGELKIHLAGVNRRLEPLAIDPADLQGVLNYLHPSEHMRWH